MGLPRFADEETSKLVFRDLEELSAEYGTELKRSGNVVTVELKRR